MMIAFFIPKSLDHVYRPLPTKDIEGSENMMMQLNLPSSRTSKKINEKMSDSDDPILIEADESKL